MELSFLYYLGPAVLALMIVSALANRKPGHKLKDDLKMIKDDVIQAEHLIIDEVKHDIEVINHGVVQPARELAVKAAKETVHLGVASIEFVNSTTEKMGDLMEWNEAFDRRPVQD
jgi:hypothetical protein